MNTIQHTDGLIAALFTPFHPDGSVHYELLPALVDHLISTGISGIFICGSNGEGPNLTLEERMQVSEKVIHAGKGRLRMIVHVDMQASRRRVSWRVTHRRRAPMQFLR
jgi:N-acetylneuraminate lyase